MKTPQERAEERRKQKLAAVKEQVDDGTLVIRQMTAKERKKYGAKTDAPRTGAARKRR